MDWKDIAGPLIKAGAPVIGTALGGPLGGLMGSALGNVVSTALGVPDTPAAVDAAIKTTAPEVLQAKLSAAEAEAQAKWPALAEIAKAQADVGKSMVTAVNESIRAETAAQAARPDGWWGHWRTLLAYELLLEAPFWAALMIYTVAFDKTPTAINDLLMASGLIMTWWAARFGVLGVHVWTGSNERQTAMTGQAHGGVVASVIKAVTKR